MAKENSFGNFKLSSKEWQLFEKLILFEQAGERGGILCAPNELKGQFHALKYNAKGELPPNDPLQKELGEYIMEARIENVKILTQKGKKEITKEFPIRYFRLSPKGEAFLSECKEKQRKAAEEEAIKKAQTLEGIRRAVNEHAAAMKQVEEKMQIWQNLPEKVREECGQLMAHIGEEYSQQNANLLQQVQKIKQMGQELRNAFEQSLSAWMEQWNAQVGPILDKLEEISQEQKSLPQLISGKIQHETGKLIMVFQQLKTTQEGWQMALQKSPLIQPQISNDSSNEKQASQAKSEKPVQPQFEFSTGSVESLPEVESRLISRILPLIPQDKPKLISVLYLELRAQGVAIRPGHLNDLLWFLYLQKKVDLQLWQGSWNEITLPEHAIFRPEGKVYSSVQKN